MLATLLQRIEEAGFFSQIRDSAYAYPILLWLHIAAVIAWGGMMLVTDLRFLGLALRNASAAEIVEGFRWPKRLTFIVAAFCGVLLFGAKAGQYSYNPRFWVKMTLVVLLAANYLIFRCAPNRKMALAAGLSLLLWMGALGAARGPATVKDIMHSMVDPSGDFLFHSVQMISDERGTREIAPQTDAQWQDVRLRVKVLLEAPAILSAPGLRAALPRDRSKNPAVENEPAEVQKLLDADRPDFARRARRLGDAASVAMQAVDAKDKDALLRALDGIDKACEVCHLRYWYPKDQRAVEAARAAGILE
jgi:hypothetical protein